MRTKKVVEIIQDLYVLKKIIQGIKEEYNNIGSIKVPAVVIVPAVDELIDDAYSIVINLIGELEEE